VASSRSLTVNGTLDCGAASTVSGNGAFTLSSGATLKTANSTGVNGSISVSGTKSFSSLANYEFMGAATGTFTTTPTANTVNNLTINNASGVTLSQNLTATGALTFTNGLLTTGTNVITAAGSIAGADATKYVSGKLAQLYSVTGSKSFPIGKSGYYRPLTVNYTSLTGTPSTVTAEQIEGSLPGSAPANTTVWNTRYWIIGETGSSARTYNVTLDGTGFSPTQTVKMIKGDGSTNTAYATTNSAPNYTATGFTSFSNFGLGEEIPAPAITTFTPSSICSGSSTSVTITGTNFTDATAVQFNGVDAASYIVNSATQITAYTPTETYSTGKISVTTPGGTAISDDDFTVTTPVTPSVSIAASANPVTSGTSVTITATPVNGGSIPHYEFFVNGSAEPTQTFPSLTIAPPAGTYDIYVIMTPDPTLPCFSPATATSNTIHLVVTASPATSTWTGGGNDHNWHTTANWDNGVPGSTTAVTIPSGLETNYPTVSSSAICASITIESDASLINNGLLGISYGGQATVKRVISDASNDKWHLFISPITQSIAATGTSCFYGAYLDRYDEPTGEWVRLLTGDDVVSSYGYSINYLAGSRELEFTGTFKNSPLTYSGLSFTPSAPGYGEGWNLIGNPYPCSIDPSKCSAPTGMNAFAYVWDNTGSGNYLTRQFGSSTALIAPLQGFFVRTTSATNSLVLANVAKTHGGTFYKNDNAEPEALVAKISGNNYSDQATVRFNSGSTGNFDQSYDAYKLWGLNEAPQLYSILPDEIAAVNTLPSIESNSIVPLGLKVGAETTYTLTFEGMESFDAQVPLRLDDLKLGISKDLRTDPVYSFTAAPGDNENRFRLRFASAIGFDDPEASNVTISTQREIIRVSYLGSAEGMIYLYNNAGQLLSVKALGRGETTLSAEATGVYIVKVVSGKSVVTQKVVVVR